MACGHQLNDSALRGMPDNQSVDYSTRTSALMDIFNVTTNLLFLTLIMVVELSI